MLCHLLRPARATLLASIVLFASSALALLAQPSSGEVSRTAPPLYTEQVAPLLTPLAEVIGGGEALLEDKPSGLVLLDETFQVVDDQGRRFEVNHSVYKALTEAGTKSLAEDVFSYRRKEQAFHLVLAETIQPDGSVAPVKPNAILVQSPQRQADYALYDDITEVKIIFPNVKPGSLTRVITVTEDLTNVMPGEYTEKFVWNSGWPRVRDRTVITLPSALAARLRVFSLGADQPEAVRETLPDGRVRLSWQRDNIPPRRFEIGRAPASQVGPSFRLTTLSSWDDVGRWFGRLLGSRDQLSPALAEQVDEWTRGLEKREDLVRVLYAKAANDVRYTGLELGQAAYQPHSCDEVWENQYGDCKDKANLLVAFLRHKGVPARLVLVNTNHLGLVDQRAPDFRVFTHAIAAIPDDRGGYLFCDPTIAYGEPGMIGPSSADRLVFVVKPDGGDWVRTPPQSAGRISHRFDLKLAPNGELSGWLEITGQGTYAAWQRSRFRKIDIYESRRRLGETVRGFFPAAEVVDVVTDAATPADSGPDTVKAYFIVPAQEGSVTARRSFSFPRASSVLPDLGTTSRRESTYFVYCDDTAVSAKISLPPGLAPGALPPDYRFETPTGTASARWRAEPAALAADLEISLRQPALTAGEFPRFFQGIQALQAWLDKPAALEADSAGAPASARPELEVDLPLMPTGEGQIELVNKRYPLTGNHALRRAAFAKTLDYFPNDKLTVFTARAYLADLDWQEDRNEQAVEQLVPLLAAYRADVPAATFAWAECIHALALRDLKRTDEALAIFNRMATDPNLPAYRRALETIHCAEMLEQTDPARAISLLFTTANLDTEYQASVNAWLARLLLANNRATELRAHLEQFIQHNPERFEETLVAVFERATRWKSPPDRDLPSELAALLRPLVPGPGDALRNALDEAGERQLVRRCSEEILAALKARFSEPAFASLLPATRDDSLKTYDDYHRAIKAAADKKDSTLAVQIALRSLLELPLDDNFPTRLWRAASYTDWREVLAGKALDEPVHLLLLDLADRLPPTNGAYLDSRLLRAYHLRRKQNYSEERAIYTAILATPRLDVGFERAASGQLGRSWEYSGDLDQALAAYKRVEPHAAGHAPSADHLLRAVYLNLHLDRADEALRILQVLSQTPDNILKDTQGEYHLRELLALAASGRAKEFWAARSSWWPQWLAIEKKLNLAPPGPETFAPVIPELTELGREIGAAQREKNAPAFWNGLRRLQSAARWVPSLGIETGDFATTVSTFAPAVARDFRLMTIAQLEVPIPMCPEKDRRARALSLAINYYDAGQPAKCFATIAAYNAAQPPADNITRAIHRVWAFAARNQRQQIAEAATQLEQDLAAPDLSDQRPNAVENLADLYRIDGRADAEIALLTREVANPHILADKKTTQKFRERLASLDGCVRLAKSVSAWLRARPISWYDYAEPADLNDPRLRNLDEVLKNPSRHFTDAQTIKLNLLVAQTAAGDLERQQKALIDAHRELLHACVTHDEARELGEASVKDGLFDDELRGAFLWTLLIDAHEQERADDYAHWASHPLVANFNEFQKQWMAAFVRFGATAKKPASLKALAAETTAKVLSPMDVAVVNDVIERLIQLGDLDSARALVAGIPDWTLASEVTQTKDALQLDYLQQLRAAEAIHPVREALRALALEKLPPPPDEPPAAYAARRTSRRVPEFPRPLMFEVLRYLAKNHGDSPRHLWFWHEFLGCLPPTPEARAFAFGMIDTALEKAPDDTVRAEVIRTFSHALDNDVPEIQSHLAETFARYLDPVSAPLTTAQIRLFEISSALRAGKSIDLAEALARIDDPDLKNARHRYQLRHYTQTRDLNMLKRTVDALGSSQLLSDDLLELSLPALDLLGRKTEAQLARAAAQRALKKTILEAWVDANPYDARNAIDLALLLGGSSPFPPGWVDTVCARSTDPLLIAHVRIGDARLRDDWRTVLKHADEVLQGYPTYYHFYRDRGTALARLGEKSAAIDALTTYTRYAKDEAEYPEALALLEKLRAK